MDLVLELRRNTVAPATAAESPSTTLPITTRWPRFCARAWGSGPRVPIGTTPAAKTINTTPAAKLERDTFILPLPLRRMTRLPLRRDRRRRATTPAAQRRPLRTPCRTLHRRPRRPPLFHPLRCPDHSRIRGRWAWQP